MSPSRHQKAARTGGQQPDDIDIKAILNALYDDCGVCAEVNFYQDLAGDLMVEASAQKVWAVGDVTLYGSARKVTPYSEKMLSVMMMELHKLYHMIQRDIAKREGLYGR